MKYTLYVYVILVFDFVVIALKVSYAKRNKNKNLSGEPGAAHAPPTGRFLNAEEHTRDRGAGGY